MCVRIRDTWVKNEHFYISKMSNEQVTYISASHFLELKICTCIYTKYIYLALKSFVCVQRFNEIIHVKQLI